MSEPHRDRAFESAQVLDVTGPLEVFSTASRFLASATVPRPRWSARGGPARPAEASISSSPSAMWTGPLDTLVVAGGPGMDAATADGSCSTTSDDSRRRTPGHLRVFGGLRLGCGGAAGRAPGHYPLGRVRAAPASAILRVTVEADAIYVRDGGMWTSAGVTAGIDLALALVADDHGRRRRHRCATSSSSTSDDRADRLRLRPAGCPGRGQEPVSDLLAGPPDHLTDDLSVAALARQAEPVGTAVQPGLQAEVGVLPRTTWKRCDWSQPAGCWRSTTRTVEKSPGPAASAPPRP